MEENALKESCKGEKKGIKEEDGVWKWKSVIIGKKENVLYQSQHQLLTVCTLIFYVHVWNEFCYVHPYGDGV